MEIVDLCTPPFMMCIFLSCQVDFPFSFSIMVRFFFFNFIFFCSSNGRNKLYACFCRHFIGVLKPQVWKWVNFLSRNFLCSVYLVNIILNKEIYFSALMVICVFFGKMCIFPRRGLNLELPDLKSNSPHCLPYSSYDVGLENLVFDQLKIP